VADGEQDDLDAGLTRASQRPSQPVAASDRLEHQREHPRVGVLDDVVDVVGRGRHQLLARGHGQVEPEPLAGAQQRREDRPRVGHQRDRTDGQVVALDVAQRAQAAANVPEAHAARPDQGHPRVGGDPCQCLPYAGCVRAPEDHGARRADGSGSREQLLEPLVADAEQHQVGGRAEVVEGRQARPAGHLVVRRVDQPDLLEPR
jgi:hypothetical protein